MNGNIREAVDAALNALLQVLMTDQGIHTGDISPEQTLEWNRLVQQAADLLGTIIEQNG